MLPDSLSHSARLPRREQLRFRKALDLLANGRGVVALVRDGRMRVAGRSVYEALLARAWAVRFDNRLERTHLAELALDLALHFPPGRYGRRRTADLQARAWGEVADAYRLAGRLPEAREALREAVRRLESGTGDPGLAARLAGMEASLRETSPPCPPLPSPSLQPGEGGNETGA
ncbi:MAG TPA: hypothetical protein VF756_25085 [Thermoanaerobaculia bacterium]